MTHSIISLLNKKRQLCVTSLLLTPTICSSCQLIKNHRLPFHQNDKQASHVLDLIHCDLWGSSPVSSNLGYKYYVIFVDDHSRFTWLYPLKFKSDFFRIFIQFQKFVETQFSLKIKAFQSNEGTEFTNHQFRDHLLNCGIHHQMSCPYTPAQNGRAE